ncbi:methyltransferase domain-containing protein [Hydrogenophaga sp.]|uniref:class I SAM-dependent methyltransferase n=1 Tax=Hydrogenophaga sp. TaxID=1904254 RepID=UPI0035ADE886
MNTTTTINDPDAVLGTLLERAQHGVDTALVSDAIGAVSLFPTDSRLRTMLAILHRAQAKASDAMAACWKALVLAPFDEVARQELLYCVSEQIGQGANDGHDFSLESGERQTAQHINGIRADHRARYAWAARLIRNHFPNPVACTGLDAFCGNGYGSRMVSDLTGARMVGIDGSTDAVALAEQYYGQHRVVFGQAVFPFELTPEVFDFAISFESVEHVQHSEALLAQLCRSSRGPVFLSVPNEKALPHASFSSQFEFHHRHFTIDDICQMMSHLGMGRVLASAGQNVYQTQGGRLSGLIPESEMHLRPASENSQFVMFMFSR